MSDEQQEQQERRPKFEPILDSPEPITLGECFWNNKSSWGYNVNHRGVDKAWFVKTAGHSEVDGYPAGTPLLVCYRAKSENPYAKWLEVRRAVVDFPEGDTVLTNPSEDKRKILIDRYRECLADAMEVAIFYDSLLPDNARENSMKTEDIRQIATAFWIERGRKNF